MTTAEIEAAFQWGEAVERQTKRGPRLLRNAPATDAAAAFWTKHEAELKEAGVALKPKFRMEHINEFCWWQPLPEHVKEERTKLGKEEVEAKSRAGERVACQHEQCCGYVAYQWCPDLLLWLCWWCAKRCGCYRRNATQHPEPATRPKR